MIFARLELTRLGSAEGNGRNRGSITGRGGAGVIIVIQGLGESPKARGFCSPRQSWEVNRRWGVERDGYSGFLILYLSSRKLGSLQHLRRELECLYVEVYVATVVGAGEV